MYLHGSNAIQGKTFIFANKLPIKINSIIKIIKIENS